MTVEEVVTKLRLLGDERTRQIHIAHGAGENCFGVKMGDIRALAKQIKSDHALALDLWKTEYMDAMLVAVLIMRPKLLSADDLDALVRSAGCSQVADWLSSYIVKAHPEKERLRHRWLADSDEFAARAGWSLTAERIAKSPEGLDLGGLLDRLEHEMSGAPALAQWTMNYCLAEIGINHTEHRERALAIGERLGIYRDYPTSKGCTSPFAPIWIREMVSRQLS